MTGAFTLDPFQQQAIAAIDRGESVLVAAPTGAGKTVVAEHAVDRVLTDTDGRVFYTTPIKALSNQKYGDLVRRHGADRVGLLTGDNSINGDARVVVCFGESVTAEIQHHHTFRMFLKASAAPRPAGPNPTRR